MEDKKTLVNEVFIPGRAYIAPAEGGAELKLEQLDNVAVGMQEHASNEGAPIVAEATAPNEQAIKNLQEAAIQKVAAKYVKHGKAKAFSVVAEIKRASRRLLLAERAKQLTCVCPETGIVSLLQVPAIPGYALTYPHPLSDLSNARGIAQRGEDYLRLLDTQTLAGILIVLANSYSLFRFQLSDSGAQKNAIIRMAGKDVLIDAIILIEESIHSKNVQYLPRLSLTVDMVANDNISMQTRMTGYVTLLAESIAKPDTAEYDENAPPKKIGRPVYIKDVEKQERKLSYMARQEIASAKKELATDAKAIKTLASNLVTLGFAKAGLKAFMAQLLQSDGMGLVEADPMILDMLITQKLSAYDHDDARKLISILRKDRSILKKEISEIDDFYETTATDPKPGQEAAIEETPEQSDTVIQEESSGLPDALDQTTIEQEQQEIIPPEGLSSIERILWLKKAKAAQGHSGNTRKYVAPVVPSVATYSKVEDKPKQENLLYSGYNADRMFLVYSNSQVPRGVYYIMDDFGNAVFARTTLPFGRE